jgi:hypothetical protein
VTWPTLITITDSAEQSPGVPASGYLTFQLNVPLSNSSTGAAWPNTNYRVPYVNGVATATVAVTNDSTTQPIGTSYTVTKVIQGAPSLPPWTIQPTLAMAPAIALQLIPAVSPFLPVFPYATSIELNAEVVRAEGAEGLLAPKASPALTGIPTVPTAGPLTGTTQAANTAYSDAGVAVEKARALAAEGSNATAITTEAATRAAADSALQSTIAGMSSTPWVANTAYAAEKIVSNGVGLYEAPAGGVPSRSTFTASDWIHLADIALPVGTTSGTVAAGDDSRIVGAASSISLAAEATARAAADTANASAITSEATTARAAEALLAQALIPTAVKTANYTAAAADLVPCDTTSGSFTVTLPNAPADRSRVAVKMVILGGTNTVTVACAGSDVLNKTGGATTATLSLLAQAIQVQYKASTHIWYVVADDLPLSQLDLRYARTITTTAGAPTTGTWVTGQSILDSNGVIWNCTAGGTPGTWMRVSGVSSARKGNRIAFMGDSTVQIGYTGTGPVNPRAWPLVWPALACMLSGQRMFLAMDAAVSGYTSGGVLSNQLPAVLADPIGFAAGIVCVGTNDIATGNGGILAGITPATTKANIAAIDAALDAAGIEPIWVTIPPRTAAAITAGATTPIPNVHAKTQAFNSWLKNFCNKNRRRCLDLNSMAIDPMTGEYKTAYSVDGIHAAGPGVCYEAELAAIELADSFPEFSPPLSSAFDDVGQTSQLLLNPLFSTVTTPPVPDNWTVDGANSTNYSVTVVPGNRVLGNSMVISNVGGPPGGARLVADQITSGFSVGDSIALGCKIRVTSTGNPQSIIYLVKITYVGASGANATLIPINNWQTTFPGVATLWVEDVVPTGTTGIQVEVLTTTNSQGKMTVSQMTLRNLSTFALTSGWWTA